MVSGKGFTHFSNLILIRVFDVGCKMAIECKPLCEEVSAENNVNVILLEKVLACEKKKKKKKKKKPFSTHSTVISFHLISPM